ncbi:MAG TPA: gliding motility protein GldN [Cytophagaceae bacterium]|nr:gliding motility protein GldN [Cytophagaceae bacterium]
MKRSVVLFVFTLAFSGIVSAQEESSKNSVNAVHVSDIMYKKTIIRALDLREKQNLPLFSRNRELPALLLDAVAEGTIKPYENDSLSNLLTIDEFSKRLLFSSASAVIDTTEMILEHGDDWENIVANQLNEKYLPRDLYQLELKEEVLFDKQHSRMRYNIQVLTLYIPADHPMNEKGIQTPLASFSYKELVENLFENNPKAIWYNTQNEREHKNLADAFDLRLFSSYIIKVSNPNDSYLADLYNDQQKGIMVSSWATEELMEYEHNLWEY